MQPRVGVQKHTDCDLVRSERIERRFLPQNSETWMNGKWVCVQQTEEKKCRVCVVEKAHWVGWGLGVDVDGTGVVAGVDGAGVVAVVVIATRISTDLAASMDTTAPFDPSHTPSSLENKRHNAYSVGDVSTTKPSHARPLRIKKMSENQLRYDSLYW